MSDDDPWLRFVDLKRMKILSNHVTLKRWIEREGFPRGRMLGPNTRAWREFEIDAWLDSRPTDNAAKRDEIPTKRILREPAATTAALSSTLGSGLASLFSGGAHDPR